MTAPGLGLAMLAGEEIERQIRKTAEAFGVEEIIDPRETRKVLAHALELSWNKVVERPARKRGVMPV